MLIVFGTILGEKDILNRKIPDKGIREDGEKKNTSRMSVIRILKI